MLDCPVYAGELVTTRNPSDSTYMARHPDEIRPEESSDQDNYALFVFEQQGRYCQLV
ncbi:MAG TPA: hypothetical protein VH643_08965 [Gemmataceae bacterium]